jgi:hypothetical protein
VKQESLHVQLDNVAVLDRVFGAGLLAVEYVFTPDAGELEVPGNIPVHQSRDIQNRIATAHRERLVRVRGFAG